jgi:thiamine-monophosphate kinase
MQLSRLGEVGILKKLATAVKTHHPDLIKGIGDDAAVIQKNKTTYYLLTTDSMLEKIHFLPGTNPFLLAQKAISINLSDIGAMGGIPKYALVSLGINRNFSLGWLEKFQRGILKICQQYQVDLIGGDLFNSSSIVISVFILGEVEKKNICFRTQTSAGEIVAVTGTLGNSRFGLEILKGKWVVKNKHVQEFFINQHQNPLPRLVEARFLAQTGYLTTLTDLSDGLAKGLLLLASENQVDLEIDLEKIPLSPHLRRMLGEKKAIQFALLGGEDYELLFTVKPGFHNSVLKKYQAHLKTPLVPIGQVKEGKGKVWLKEGKRRKLLTRPGFDHFGLK